MAQQQSQSGGGSTDSGMGPIWITVLLFVTVYLIWALARAQIVKVIFFFNLIQAKLVAFVVGPAPLAIDINWMMTVDPGSVEWDQIVASSLHIGSFIRYPFCFLLCVLAVVLYQSDITRKFKHAHNMKTLRAQEQKNWPCIMPVVNEDLAKVDISDGPWAMALNPIEFAKKNGLLKKEDPFLDATPGSRKNPGDQWTAGIRKVDAKRIFTLQLGPVWEGFEKATPQARAMAAVFMARMNRDRDGASMILDTLVKTAVQGKPNYAVADAVLKKHQHIESVQEITQKHAYLLTVMASLLQASRQDGVVPSSEFLWLKLFDRRLWYMLNCVGRQTPYAEVAGPFAHWRAEQVLGRRSLIPMVDEAIRALEIAIKEVKLSPKELQGLKP